MKTTTVTLGLVVLVVGLSLLIARCSPDWYAEIPCESDSQCPQDYHCESQKCTTGEAAGEPGFEFGTSAKSIDFGEVQVGDSVTKELSVKNVSKAGSQIQVIPSFSKDYKAVTVDPKAQVSVGLGSSVKFKLTYKPTTAEPIPELYLVVTSNETGSPLRRILLSGSAIAPHLVYSPDTGIDSGKVYRGATAPAQTLTLTNTGKGTLRIDSIAVTQAAGTGFSLPDVPTAFPVNLDGDGGSIDLKVDFRPTTEGKKSAAVTVQTNEYNRTTVSIPLAGEGQACKDGYWDVDGKPENGCEYGPCSLTDAKGAVCKAGDAGCGIEVCDGKDNDCNGQIDDGPIDQLCPNDPKLTHATYMCSKGACIIKECETGWWDRDKKAENGCEAACELTNKAGEVCTKGDPGCGVEVCDGLDNDCNGKPDDGVITDMCPIDDKTMPHVQKGAGTITCALDPADNKTRCIFTCESGWDNCLGKADILLHGCPTAVINDVNNCGACGKVCTIANATAACNGDKCVISKCNDGYWDNDGDPTTGCEYGPCALTDAKGQPCQKSDPGCGVEACDGKDNDCNGKIDDALPDTLCPPVLHTTFACDQAVCKITACDNGWYDVDKDPKTGCECQAVGGGGGDTCGGAKDLGQLAESGGSLSIKGNLTPAGKVEWYRFVGADDVAADEAAGFDKYHVTVKFITNPGNQYTFDAYIDSCDPSSVHHELCDIFEWMTDLSTTDANGPVGEKPCTALNNPSIPHCQDDTHTYMIKVYRDPSVQATCEQFELEVSNGKYSN